MVQFLDVPTIALLFLSRVGAHLLSWTPSVDTTLVLDTPPFTTLASSWTRAIFGELPVTVISTDRTTNEKRYDIAILVIESEVERRERTYAQLDPKELSISPEERFLRVASANHCTGEIEGIWSERWDPLFGAFDKEPIRTAKQLFQLAYDAKYGPKPPLHITNMINIFDIAYRKMHGLPVGIYRELTTVAFPRTISPDFF